MNAAREAFLERLDRAARQFLREAAAAGHALSDLDGDYLVSIKDGALTGVELADRNEKTAPGVGAATTDAPAPSTEQFPVAPRPPANPKRQAR